MLVSFPAPKDFNVLMTYLAWGTVNTPVLEQFVCVSHPVMSYSL